MAIYTTTPLATIHEEANRLYVNTLLMRQVYERALAQDKAFIELKPLTNSFTYYRDHLKMTISEKGDTFA